MPQPQSRATRMALVLPFAGIVGLTVIGLVEAPAGLAGAAAASAALPQQRAAAHFLAKPMFADHLEEASRLRMLL